MRPYDEPATPSRYVVTTNGTKSLQHAAYPLTTHEIYPRLVKPQQQNENEFLHWTPEKLHRLVAHFLRVRFPMLLALNKVCALL